jgi:hypothetical protein
MENKLTVIASLALAGLLIVNSSFADEIVVAEKRQDATTSTAEMNRDRAAKAHLSAVEKAVEAVLSDTRLDLDIRLIGPTSVKIAAER